MTSMIRLGVAAAALAFTSAARPCDVRGYDPAADGPRDGACPMIVRYAPSDATDYDASPTYAAMNDEAAGSGSGEPEATDPPDNHPSEDEFLQAVWTAP